MSEATPMVHMSPSDVSAMLEGDPLSPAVVLEEECLRVGLQALEEAEGEVGRAVGPFQDYLLSHPEVLTAILEDVLLELGMRVIKEEMARSGVNIEEFAKERAKRGPRTK
jgi:hypothetical protein